MLHVGVLLPALAGLSSPALAQVPVASPASLAAPAVAPGATRAAVHPGLHPAGGSSAWLLPTADVQSAGAGTSRLAPTLASAAVPGAGQLLLGHRRGWAYLAIEALGWVAYADRRSEGARYRTRYRDLAWTTARSGSGTRVDGDFAYYERLSLWTRSGRFDMEGGTGGIQPETDPTTFNGSVWRRARGIFSVEDGDEPGSPRFDAALAYYAEQAYGEAFLWDWTGDPGARDQYAGWIRESDERFRQATWALGVLFANHLVAAADAWVSTPASLSLTPVLSADGGPAARILLRVELHR